MNVKDIIKKQTTVIAIAVCLVTIAALGVSYALFFDIKEGSNQVITAGTLKLTISSENGDGEPNTPMTNLTEPMSNDEGMKSNPVKYTLKNTGNLPASYKLYICVATDNVIDKKSIRVSTKDDEYKSLGESTIGEENSNNYFPKSTETIDENMTECYLIDEGTIKASETEATKSLRVWIDEEEINDDLDGEKVDLDLYLVSEVDEATAENTAGTGT